MWSQLIFVIVKVSDKRWKNFSKRNVALADRNLRNSQER